MTTGGSTADRECLDCWGEILEHPSRRDAPTDPFPPAGPSGPVHVPVTKAQPEQAPAPAPGSAGRRRFLAWIMLGLGLVILFVTAWVGWRTLEAYRSLQAAGSQVASLQQQLSNPSTLGSAPERVRLIAELQANSATARAAVDDPVYRLATGIPVIGPNLDAVRQLSVSVDDLATTVVPSLASVAQDLDPSALAPKDGAVQLQPLVRIAPELNRADTAVRQAQRNLADVDRSAVVTPIGDAVAALQTKLDAVADLTGPAARAARLLPPALGSEGPRTYLLLFQNLAEPRSTGGIFGSYALLTADQGRVSITDQGPARDLRYFDPPVSEISAQQQQIFGSELAVFPADVNLTPDFPTAARLFAQMVRERGGPAVDGVVAVDPVALAYLLAGSPPLEVDGVAVDATNLVSTLLSRAYQSFGDDDHDPRDDFLAKTTSAAFAEISGGAVHPDTLVAGVRKAAAERRLLYYSFHDDEQQDVAGTGLSGAIDGSAESSTIGAFINDAVASKLGYYLRVGATVSGGQCQPDGSQLAAVTINLDYQPPAEGVPQYVAGRSDDGSYRVQVQLAAPSGGRLDAATLDGQPVSLRLGEDLGRPFGIAVVDLLPGAKSTLTFFLAVPPGTDPQLVHTPTVGDWPIAVDGIGGCAP